MIAHAKPSVTQEKPERNDAAFTVMLPSIQRQAQRAFRGVRRDLREELVAEVIANAFVAFRRLVERDKADLAYPTVLAKFAVKQVRQGRRVGSKMNVRDVSSYYCRKKNCIKRHPLGEGREHDRENVRSWQDEILVEDRHATPADTAAIRIDFTAWLRSLDRRQRRIAKTLAANETTETTARKFNLSAGRISQIRRQLERAWLLFQGELLPPTSTAEPPITAVNRSLAAVGEAV